jgi:hypothetical protein
MWERQALVAKEPDIANNMTLIMKEYEKITDAEMRTIGRVGGSLLTILAVVAAIFVVVSILAALALGGVVLFYGWAIFQLA